MRIPLLQVIVEADTTSAGALHKLKVAHKESLMLHIWRKHTLFGFTCVSCKTCLLLSNLILNAMGL